VLLVLLGVGWLFDSLDVATMDWDLLLPAGLIVVGVALVLTARRGEGHGGLIALGVILTVLLTIGTAVEIPLSGGVGDRTERPLTLRDRSYELAIGKLTVDLSRVGWSQDVPAQARIEARVGIGQLVVVVPDRIACVSTHARAGIGEVNVFGETEGGIGPEYRPEAVCLAAPVLELELSIGIGEVEVRRG
jgi:predicted membrane protein